MNVPALRYTGPTSGLVPAAQQAALEHSTAVLDRSFDRSIHFDQMLQASSKVVAAQDAHAPKEEIQELRAKRDALAKQGPGALEQYHQNEIGGF